MARPSNFGSAAYSTLAAPTPSCTRRSNARTSSSSKALLIDSIGARCRTSANSASGGAPTRFVGEAGLAGTAAVRASARQAGSLPPPLGELGKRPRSHALRRRVGARQLGMVALELEQAAEHPVVLGVADLGRVLDVVKEIVPLDLAPQSLGALAQVPRRRHGIRRTAAAPAGCRARCRSPRATRAPIRARPRWGGARRA